MARLAPLLAMEATVAAFLFVLAIVTEPLWQPVLATMVRGTP